VSDATKSYKVQIDLSGLSTAESWLYVNYAYRTRFMVMGPEESVDRWLVMAESEAEVRTKVRAELQRWGSFTDFAEITSVRHA
jgi:hypothetical protein